MTAFGDLSASGMRALTVLLFFAAFALLALCLYEHVSHAETLRRVRDGAVFGGALLLLALLTACADGTALEIKAPWLLILSLGAALLVRAIWGLARERRESRDRLSPWSIKEALDDLPSGVLFTDAAGRTVLVNRSLGRLSAVLLGALPQTLGELKAALSKPEARGVTRLDDDLYRFPDGHVWRFRFDPLRNARLAGFTQTGAQDVTEVWNTNEALARENAALQKTVAELRALVDRLSDRVREQETLELKIRVHNDIGASLIALSELYRSGETADTDEQLRLLEQALLYFSSRGADAGDSLESVRRQAAEMRVSIAFDGALPTSKRSEALLAAAARECLTNCVRHARGRQIEVKTDERGGTLTARITNDGEKPKGPIQEGGGLSALRKRLEAAGGTMRTDWEPRFQLEVTIPEGGEAE